MVETTAIETTAYAEDIIRKIIPLIDHILLDIKAIPEDVHKKGTGVSNKLILQNSLIINEISKNLTVRVPIIPNFNFSELQCHYICKFVKHLDKVFYHLPCPYQILVKANIKFSTKKNMNYAVYHHLNKNNFIH